MAKYLDWYLVELEMKLGKGMRSEEVFALLNQTADHICSIKEELMAAGMEENYAEQAAIQRFGQVETLTGKQPALSNDRGNWAAPTLIVLGATGVLAAALWFGSYAAIAVSAGLAGACLFVSALLCARKGKFPGLAFGILLTCCVTGLSVVGGFRFLGSDLQFVRRVDAPGFRSAILKKQREVERVALLFRAGKSYRDAGKARQVPGELVSSDGVICPPKDGQWQNWGGSTAAWHRYGISGRLTSVLLESYRFDRVQDEGEALDRWQRDDMGEFDQAVHQNPRILADALLALENSPRFESENLFFGIAIGSGITTLWLLIAFVMNRLANVRFPTARPADPQRRLA